VPNQVIYFKNGVQPANPANQTNACGVCTPTMASRSYNNLVFDTEADARTTFKAFGRTFIETEGKGIWDALWTAFQCTNQQQCSKAQSCGAKPTYLEAGVDSVMNAAGNWVWQYYLVLAREIKCVAADGKAPIDDPPQILDPPPPPPPAGGKTELKPGPPSLEDLPPKRDLSIDFVDPLGPI
jgi:hypothetical protein